MFALHALVFIITWCYVRGC